MKSDNGHGDNRRLDDARDLWDAAASTFDDEPDHGLRDAAVRAAWSDLLRTALPAPRGRLLDIGCGTGSLSVALASHGWEVTGIDLSPQMIERATDKALTAGVAADFRVMDAAYPQFEEDSFDALLCRHVLWALPDIGGVLERWAALMKPGGRIVMIEGFWHTGAGLHVGQILQALAPSLTFVMVINLSGRADLWGSDHGDERYAVFAERRD